MCAYSSTRGAWQQSLSQTARTLSTFRYFLRGTAVVLMGKCMGVHVRVWVHSVHVSPLVSTYEYAHSCHRARVCFWALFFSWGFRANRAGLFVVIHEIALGLHAIGSSNSLTFFPTSLFRLVMDWGGGLVRWAQIQHHTVLPRGFLAVTQQHPQDHYSPSYPRPEFFIWSHCLLLNSHLWGD